MFGSDPKMTTRFGEVIDLYAVIESTERKACTVYEALAAGNTYASSAIWSRRELPHQQITTRGLTYDYYR